VERVASDRHLRGGVHKPPECHMSTFSIVDGLVITVFEGTRKSLIFSHFRKEYWFKEKMVFPPKTSLSRMAGFRGSTL